MTSPAGGDHYQQDIGAPGGPGGPKITTIFDFTAEALEQLAFWLEQRGLHIPFTQILGASQFLPTHSGTVQPNVPESITSATYGDLATVGPTLSGLSDGRYVVFHGAKIEGNAAAGNPGFQSISINSAAAADADSCSNSAASAFVSVNTAVLKTLSGGGNNTITCKYRSNGGAVSARFSDRWLMALRYGN